MAAQKPRGLRLSYARLNSARATVGITPRPGALPLNVIIGGRTVGGFSHNLLGAEQKVDFRPEAAIRSVRSEGQKGAPS